MAKASPIINSFNAGELSPRMAAKVDFAKYQNGCERLENFVLFPHGGACFRPGSYFVSEVKDSSKKVRLVRFVFSVVQAYVLEFGNQYIRVYKDRGQVQSGGSAYEIASPYLEAHLQGLKFAQSADVLYIFHASYAPRKLTRTGHTAWTLTTINFTPPPVSELDVFPAATLTPGATTGSGVTFTAGSAYFQTGDIDRQIISGASRAVIKSVPSSPGTQCVADILDAFSSTSPIASGSWSLRGSPTGFISPDKMEPKGASVSITATGGVNVRSSLYKWDLTGAGTAEYMCMLADGSEAGLSEPSSVIINGAIATKAAPGSLAAGQWGWGSFGFSGQYKRLVVRLADDTDPDGKADGYIFTGATGAATRHVFRAADVGKYIRAHNGTIKLTAFTSAVHVTGEIIEPLDAVDATESWTLESPAWSSALGYPRAGCFYESRLWLARDVWEWGSVVEDFENFAMSDRDDAAVSRPLLANEVNEVMWLAHGKVLMAGTVGGEWAMKTGALDEPITPANLLPKRKTTHGCADVPPIVINESILFVQRAGRKLRELAYRYESDGFIAPDLTILAEHITAGGIIDMAYQEEPNGVLWTVRGDGVLLGLTYDRLHDVVGWHRHPMEGEVESVAVIPGPGDEDELWLSVKRTINGAVKRYIEYLKPFSWGSDQEDCFFLDCGLTYDGAPATTISGLEHLEGKSVGILADGAVHPDRTVASGEITLARSAGTVHVGLKYTGVLLSMDLEAGSATGTSQGKLKRIHKARVRFLHTLGGKVGSDLTRLETVYYRTSADPMDAPPPLFTGDKEVTFPKGWDHKAQVMIVQDQPLPMTVLGIMPEMSTSDE
jgi:hypothetical protein